MKLEGIQQRFGSRLALDIDRLDFHRGHVYAIVGSNGCGKTTLARIVCGLQCPTAGVRKVDEGEMCGYMPQKNYAFFGTVKHNIDLGLRAGDHGADREDQVIKALGLSALAHAKAKSLSGGETARMALARILVGDATVLVLDEPTAAFDVASTLAAEQLIAEYRVAHNACILLITHSIGQARRASDSLIFLDEGRVVESGPTARVLDNPRTPEFQRFIDVVGA